MFTLPQTIACEDTAFMLNLSLNSKEDGDAFEVIYIELLNVLFIRKDDHGGDFSISSLKVVGREHRRFSV